MALKRVMRRRKPVRTLASEVAITIRDAASLTGMSVVRNSEPPVPSAPRISEARKPTSGSTSRRMGRSAIARISIRGMTTPLRPSATRLTTPSRHPISWWSRTGSDPRSAPWRATTRMIVRIRLAPSTKRFRSRSDTRTESEPESMDRSPEEHEDQTETGRQGSADQQVRHRSETEARHDRLHDPHQHREDHECGQEDAPRSEPTREHGHDQAHEQAPEEEQLEAGSVEDRRQGRTAVVEHHHLVDHGQLEVRVRIVERDPAVLHQRHDEESRPHEHQSGPQG